jgi:hypothetical protein
MGCERCHEDPNARHERRPKLAATGQLSGTLDGRPVEIIARDKKLELRFAKIASAWKLRRIQFNSIARAIKLLQDSKFEISARVGGVRIEVLPNPNFAMRFLAPDLYRMIQKGTN